MSEPRKKKEPKHRRVRRLVVDAPSEDEIAKHGLPLGTKPSVPSQVLNHAFPSSQTQPCTAQWYYQRQGGDGGGFPVAVRNFSSR
ncbi:TPA_asm: MC014.1L [Molluscum contagiosum virus]|uniref:MC014.1L n=1 Tax=Molluscum contagiosum virus TaxID=10279 RepID=A0A858A325_9POXV|nr:MC014.1 [Molluscum contagiosum virus subtype 1]QHW16746.1 MC014.1L [Molluscum contagiosum virus]AQY16937.1 MC014.1 [Molluscum contagiosum virus subtype 1]AQY17115.1 MC014.1 [Molluscum contagiosum virus subtype 1]AYO87469.1 MC014.1 [Molluscum contagiosum virus subtype 1]